MMNPYKKGAWTSGVDTSIVPFRASGKKDPKFPKCLEDIRIQMFLHEGSHILRATKISYKNPSLWCKICIHVVSPWRFPFLRGNPERCPRACSVKTTGCSESGSPPSLKAPGSLRFWDLPSWNRRNPKMSRFVRLKKTWKTGSFFGAPHFFWQIYNEEL